MDAGASRPDAQADHVEIARGVSMPRLGLGTWHLQGDLLRRVMDQSFVAGYRMIDTASYYGNETDVGVGIRLSGLPRESLFVTTKIRGIEQGRKRTAIGAEHSLDRLNLDYVDLLCIHWPLPMRDLYLATWEELIRLRDRGLTRAIGVSNFNPGHLNRLIDATGVSPSVNQIQRNPAVPNAAMRDHNDSRGVHTQAWEPLGLRSNVLGSQVVRAAAEHLGRTPAQVVLRWHIQSGDSAVPKTATASRLRENLDVFGWELPEDMRRDLDELDEGGIGRVDPDINVVD